MVATTAIMAIMPRQGSKGLVALALAIPVTYWLTGPMAVILVFGVLMLEGLRWHTIIAGCSTPTTRPISHQDG